MKIVADGDSWFSYPRLLFTGGGVIDHLSRQLGGIKITNLATPSDDTRLMLSLPQRRQLEKELVDADFLLFSGGGNDIVGDQFCIWLNDNVDDDPDKALSPDRLGAALATVRAAYDDLALIRDSVAPDCVIVTHSYDIPYPSDKGVWGKGPWLKPSLNECGWTNPAAMRAIATRLLRAFDRMLASWTIPNRIHVPTLGTLDKADWQNEIHPNRQGYAKIAKLFATALRAHPNFKL